jgi:hypothetical protein
MFAALAVAKYVNMGVVAFSLVSITSASCPSRTEEVKRHSAFDVHVTAQPIVRPLCRGCRSHGRDGRRRNAILEGNAGHCVDGIAVGVERYAVRGSAGFGDVSGTGG